MASPKEVAPLLPDTLPDDFGDWDGSGSPSPTSTSEWDTAFDSAEPSKPAKPSERSDDRDALLASLMDKQRLTRSGSPAQKQNDFVNWEREAPPAPPRDKSRLRDAAPLRSESARPLGKPPGRESSTSALAVARPVDAWPAVSEPAFAKPQSPASEPAQA